MVVRQLELKDTVKRAVHVDYPVVHQTSYLLGC